MALLHLLVDHNKLGGSQVSQLHKALRRNRALVPKERVATTLYRRPSPKARPRAWGYRRQPPPAATRGGREGRARARARGAAGAATNGHAQAAQTTPDTVRRRQQRRRDWRSTQRKQTPRSSGRQRDANGWAAASTASTQSPPTVAITLNGHSAPPTRQTSTPTKTSTAAGAMTSQAPATPTAAPPPPRPEPIVLPQRAIPVLALAPSASHGLVNGSLVHETAAPPVELNVHGHPLPAMLSAHTAVFVPQPPMASSSSSSAAGAAELHPSFQRLLDACTDFVSYSIPIVPVLRSATTTPPISTPSTMDHQVFMASDLAAANERSSTTTRTPRSGSFASTALGREDDSAASSQVAPTELPALHTVPQLLETAAAASTSGSFPPPPPPPPPPFVPPQRASPRSGRVRVQPNGQGVSRCCVVYLTHAHCATGLFSEVERNYYRSQQRKSSLRYRWRCSSSTNRRCAITLATSSPCHHLQVWQLLIWATRRCMRR